MEHRPTVFLVDDDLAVRDALRLLMESVSLPVQAYATAQEFLDTYDPSLPGCLVLDVRLPGMSGLELQEELNARKIYLPVIIITGHGDVPMAVRAMKAGAFDFLEKPFNDQELLDRIHQAIRRDLRRREREAQRDLIAARVALLTPREREVLNMTVAGKTNQMIAEELHISRKTLDIHRSKIMEKMQAQGVADLIRLALLVEGADCCRRSSA
ncbi:MAG TPA: response regulator [Gemmataceae bacterium]|nr:response regulator [Gemmataceae bacterium]